MQKFHDPHHRSRMALALSGIKSTAQIFMKISLHRPCVFRVFVYFSVFSVTGIKSTDLYETGSDTN